MVHHWVGPKRSQPPLRQDLRPRFEQSMDQLQHYTLVSLHDGSLSFIWEGTYDRSSAMGGGRKDLTPLRRFRPPLASCHSLRFFLFPAVALVSPFGKVYSRISNAWVTGPGLKKRITVFSFSQFCPAPLLVLLAWPSATYLELAPRRLTLTGMTDRC